MPATRRRPPVDRFRSGHRDSRCSRRCRRRGTRCGQKRRWRPDGTCSGPVAGLARGAPPSGSGRGARVPQWPNPYTIYAAPALSQCIIHESRFNARQKKGPPACRRPLSWKRWVRSVAAAPLVVQADADDVVGGPEGLASVGSDRGPSDRDGGRARQLGLAEVDVEIFELGAPAATQGALDAGADGPSGLHILEGGDGRCRDRSGADVQDRAVLDLTVGDTRRTIDQDVRAPQEAQPAARGAEPLELVVGRQRRGNGADAGDEDTSQRRATLLAGTLEIGFPAPHPAAELIVVAGLDAADHAVDLLGFRYRVAGHN